ncbi:MAG: phosphopantetheine-binding protein [Candidatus Methylacidiphilales bacterium]|nr:phosphopantetheine-binding protein [Candidatus Methylacidiphilales bacterium]
MSLTAEQEQVLRESFKRHSPETVESIIRFRKEGDASGVVTAIHGIIEKYITVEERKNLSECPDSARLIEDLGIDSLTMLEIVMSVEEAFNFRIDDNDARNIRTIGDVRRYVDDRVHNRPTQLAETRIFTREDILGHLPQQDPFFFLDSAETRGETVRAKYLFRGDEFFFKGHFKTRPVVPASIVSEAVGQAASLWLHQNAQARLNPGEKLLSEFLFVSMEGTRFSHLCVPGDEILIDFRLTRFRAPLAVFQGTVHLKSEVVARYDALTLAFAEFPEPAASVVPQAT